MYDGQEALLKMNGLFRSFTNVKGGIISYSIRMTVDKTNEDFLLVLERRIRGQVTLQICDIYKEDVNLIKFSHKGYRNVSLKVYKSKAPGFPMSCKFRRKLDGELEVISPEKMADTASTGLKVYYVDII